MQFDKKKSATIFCRFFFVFILLLTTKIVIGAAHAYEFQNTALAKRLYHRSFLSFVCLRFLLRIGKSSPIYSDKNGIYVKRKMETRLQMTPIAPRNIPINAPVMVLLCHDSWGKHSFTVSFTLNPCIWKCVIKWSMLFTHACTHMLAQTHQDSNQS